MFMNDYVLEASRANVTKMDNNMQGSVKTYCGLVINSYWLLLLHNPVCS